MAENNQALWPARWVRGLIWVVYLCAWSTALLVRLPPPPDALSNPDVQFTVAKSLHVCAYAGLAILAGWLRPVGWWRWLLLAALFAHGVLTEFFQWYFPSLGRNGCVADVIRDWIGISLGLAVSYKLWFTSKSAQQE